VLGLGLELSHTLRLGFTSRRDQTQQRSPIPLTTLALVRLITLVDAEHTGGAVYCRCTSQ